MGKIIANPNLEIKWRSWDLNPDIWRSTSHEFNQYAVLIFDNISREFCLYEYCTSAAYL